MPSDWADEYDFCQPDYVQTGANGTCSTDLDSKLAPDGYDWTTSNSFKRYKAMSDALAAVQDTNLIEFNMCIWGTADVVSWGNLTASSWRMSNDIEADWGDITRIINLNCEFTGMMSQFLYHVSMLIHFLAFWMNSVGFFGHNDADMLGEFQL